MHCYTCRSHEWLNTMKAFCARRHNASVTNCVRIEGNYRIGFRSVARWCEGSDCNLARRACRFTYMGRPRCEFFFLPRQIFTYLWAICLYNASSNFFCSFAHLIMKFWYIGAYMFAHVDAIVLARKLPNFKLICAIVIIQTWSVLMV